MPRVLIADAVSAECDAILQERGIDVVRAVGVPRAELLALLPGFEGMIVRSAVQVDREMIDAMAGMRAIGRAGAGVDNIDVPAATERGIVVMNTPGGNTISATEHTLALLLAVLRRVPAANASLRAEKWDRKSFTGSELMAKRVGVLGLGRIGREVAVRVAAFGATVLGYDPLLSSGAVRDLGVEPVTFEELIAGSDIISVHIPLVPATRGLIGTVELARMRRGVFLINCSRGGIIDEAALLEALNIGQVAGAGLDVFDGEPPAFPNPLIAHPSVVATPHIAASTEEAQTRVAIDIAHQIAELFEGRGARGVVNAVGLEESLLGSARPLMDAAELLGRILGQWCGADLKGCRLVASGAEATPILRGLGAAFLAGIVSATMGTAANPINAELLAERSGITLETAGEEAHDLYSSLIVAEASCGDAVYRAAITPFGANEPRLVMIDDVWLEIRPAGTMLLLENDDRPGVLAVISTLLAEHGINIADVALGRRESLGSAITAVRTDQPVNDDLLEKLRALDVVRWVRKIEVGTKREE